MGWIADLLKEIPSAARYKAELEAMEKENASLRNENSALQAKLMELEAKLKFEKLPEECERILAFLSRHEDMPTTVIAGSLSLTVNLAKMHLEDLIEGKYIDAHYTIGQEPEHYLLQKGRKYVIANKL